MRRIRQGALERSRGLVEIDFRSPQAGPEVQQGMRGHPVRPYSKATLAPERVEFRHQTDENFLRGVARVLHVSQHSEREVKNIVLDSPLHTLEGDSIASLRPDNELV